jgi:hypothetical protein
MPQILLVAVQLKTTVTTRFLYTYDVLECVLRHWDAMRSALAGFRAGGALDVPILDDTSKRLVTAVHDMLKPIRASMVGTVVPR